jgi:hypothetical protein
MAPGDAGARRGDPAARTARVGFCPPGAPRTRRAPCTAPGAVARPRTPRPPAPVSTHSPFLPCCAAPHGVPPASRLAARPGALCLVEPPPSGDAARPSLSCMPAPPPPRRRASLPRAPPPRRQLRLPHPLAILRARRHAQRPPRAPPPRPPLLARHAPTFQGRSAQARSPPLPPPSPLPHQRSCRERDAARHRPLPAALPLFACLSRAITRPAASVTAATAPGRPGQWRVGFTLWLAGAGNIGSVGGGGGVHAGRALAGAAAEPAARGSLWAGQEREAGAGGTGSAARAARPKPHDPSGCAVRAAAQSGSPGLEAVQVAHHVAGGPLGGGVGDVQAHGVGGCHDLDDVLWGCRVGAGK